MKSKLTLELSDARKVIAAAEQEALRNGWNVSIAVCDDSGALVMLLRMDGAAPVSAAIAPEKARTSVLTRKPTKQSEEMINGGRFAALKMPIVPLEGGEMLMADGHCVGGIGVSGVRPGQDAQIAQAGVAGLPG
ncbi:MAG: heme-binding protein [Rhodocyclaceae bacterium]|nr:heme-binding protein [Rhodocyclaceae bacterium]MBX3667137.1 heme-binding protein [Rhodocyclaceae bacterium]